MCYETGYGSSVQCDGEHEVECNRFHLDELRALQLPQLSRRTINLMLVVVVLAIVWELTIVTILMLGVLR